MAALWAADSPLTTAELQAHMGSELAYNTLQTILIRLTAKGRLERRQRGRAHVYWPKQDESSSVADELRATLGAAGDRAQTLREFAAGLDEQDASILRQWLDSQPKGDG